MLLTHIIYLHLDLKFRFPAPKIPPMSIIPDVFGDALSIAIVSFAVNISMAKLFSKKYKYDLSPNQVFILINFILAKNLTVDLK